MRENFSTIFKSSYFNSLMPSDYIENPRGPMLYLFLETSKKYLLLFIGSVRENILFNRPMNEEKLDKIIEACYLSQVIATFVLN